MGSLNSKSKIKNRKNTEEKTCFKNENNLEDSNINYNYGDIIFIPLILDQIFQFINDDDKKNLYFCNKKFYQLYCNQITKLKMEKYANISIVKNIKI